MKVLEQLKPPGLELASYLVASAILLVVSDLSFLARAYNFTDDQIYLSSASNQLFQSGLVSLDNLFFAPYLATILFWAIVGIFLLSLGRSVRSVYSELKQDIDVSTKFWHPRNYTKAQFWSTVILDFIFQVGGFAIFGLVLFATLFIFLPISLVAARIYMVSPANITNLPYYFLGLALLFSAICLCAFCARIIYYRASLIKLLFKQ